MTARRAAAALAAALSVGPGCGEPAPVLAPVVESPAPGEAAYPWDEIDRVTLSVGRAGDPERIVSATFQRGQAPALAQVPYGDDLVVHLSGKSDVFEVAYGRTCALDLRPDEPPPEARLYFARTYKWAIAPAPAVGPRAGARAFADRAGGGVFVGGVFVGGVDGGGGATGAIERFDPAAGAFVALPSAVEPRNGAALATFGDGRALLVGGVDVAGDAVPFVEIVDPLALAPRQVERLSDPRFRLRGTAAISLVDGSVVVIGGEAQAADGGPFTATDRAWRFAFGEGGLLATPTELESRLEAPRVGHTLTRLGDDSPGAPVLVVGGRDAAGATVATAALYEPLRRAFASSADFAPQMVRPRWGHSAARLADGSVLVLGGWDAGGQPVTEVEQYLQGTFRSTNIVLDVVSDFSVTTLPDGSVLVAGGRDAAGQPLRTAWIARLDPAGGVQLVRTDDLGAPRAGHAAVRLCDGTVLVAGGETAPAAPGAERYNPPSTSRE